MADVRAEILAASRSRTGWLEGSVQTNESQPFVSKVKSTFEEKTANQDNKLASNTSKSEAVRRLGSKVSSIATLFQSFSPHKNECSKTSNVPVVNKGEEKRNQKPSKTDQTKKVDSNTEISTVSQKEVESHQKRFNSARAIFEQLGEKNKDTNRTSDTPKDFPTEIFDSSSSKLSVSDKDKIPNQSNRNSSQSSPEEEVRNSPFCRKSYNQRASPLPKIERKYDGEKISENLISPDNSRDFQPHLNDYTDNLQSHYSQIYEEIPNVRKDVSKVSWNSSYSSSFEQSENSLKTQEDKNANTTNSYSDSYSNNSVDSSMPIYAKVIKKRSKPQSNFNQDVEQKSSLGKTNDVNKEYSSGDDEKDRSVYKSGYDQVFHGNHSNKAVCSKDKVLPPVNNAVTENTYEEIQKIENSGHKSDSFNDSWESLGISSSSSWKKKPSDNANTQDGLVTQCLQGNF